MGRSNQRQKRNTQDAPRHTAIICDPVTMWSKLAWDADLFRDIQTSYPEEIEPLCYAAINVCIAAWSLRQWAEAFAQKVRESYDVAKFNNDLDQAIPEQVMCDAIANSAKHARFDEGRWAGGEVTLAYDEGDEDIPPGYVLYHEAGPTAGFAVTSFDRLVQNWWEFLTDRGWTEGRSRTPTWRQNKLNQIFGDHTYTLPDGAMPLDEN